MTPEKDTFLKLPKGDLHNHLHLGANRNWVKTRYGNSAPKFPLKYMGLDDMITFIQKDVNKLLNTQDDIVFLMENAIETCIADNVVYLEASIDIGLTRFFNNSIEKLIETIIVLKEKYKESIDFRPDIGINKEADLEKIYSDGVKCIDSDVFYGIDIYGKEDRQVLDKFVEIYTDAKNKKLRTKVHIGEFSNCTSIEEAITLLNPDHIQHGIRAAESMNTMQLLLDKNIQLNICPQSNIALGAVSNIADHPIRKLYDFGIKITINTDDFLLFNSSITNQYSDLERHKVFTIEELDTIRKNSLGIQVNDIA